MEIIKILIVINYIVALLSLYYIATDKYWNKIVDEYKDKDKETYELMQKKWFRHFMCLVMIMPGYCLYLILNNMYKKIFK